MGWDGGQPWQWDTELLYSLQREKCHPPSGCGVFFPLFFLPFPPAFSSQLSARQFAGARHRQARLGCCPGSGQTGQGGTFGVNMWHVGVPKAWLVASICFSKSLSGSFTHVTARICWKRRGETHSLSALGPQGCWSCQQEHASSWQAEASSKVSAWLREILTPPRSTSSAFKEHKRQVLSCHASCPVFPKAKLFFQGLGKADLAPAPSPWPRGCSKPCAYPSTSSEHERGCSSSPTQN